MWPYFFMGLLLLVIGFAVHILKWNMLIAGYNTMPKKKKENVDTEKLGKLLGFYAYISGGFFLILALVEFLGTHVPPTPVTIIFIVWTIIILYNAQKYDGNTKIGKDYQERNKND